MHLTFLVFLVEEKTKFEDCACFYEDTYDTVLFFEICTESRIKISIFLPDSCHWMISVSQSDSGASFTGGFLYVATSITTSVSSSVIFRISTGTVPNGSNPSYNFKFYFRHNQVATK
jgi:hypothetical protein